MEYQDKSLTEAKHGLVVVGHCIVFRTILAVMPRLPAHRPYGLHSGCTRFHKVWAEIGLCSYCSMNQMQAQSLPAANQHRLDAADGSLCAGAAGDLTEVRELALSFGSKVLGSGLKSL